MLAWVFGIVLVLVLFPLLAVEIHHRHERRRHKVAGRRRTDKINLHGKGASNGR